MNTRRIVLTAFGTLMLLLGVSILVVVGIAVQHGESPIGICAGVVLAFLFLRFASQVFDDSTKKGSS